MSKKVDKKFKPLSHDNLKSKQVLLEYAQNLIAKPSLENNFTAVMIYIDFAEYITKNLLQNLRFYIYKGTHTQYTGVLFIDETGLGDDKNFQKKIQELRRFHFLDKDKIIECLQNISEAKDNIFYEFSESNIHVLEKAAAENLSIIQHEVGELADRIDTLYACLQKIDDSGSKKNISIVHLPEADDDSADDDYPLLDM